MTYVSTKYAFDLIDLFIQRHLKWVKYGLNNLKFQWSQSVVLSTELIQMKLLHVGWP